MGEQRYAIGEDIGRRHREIGHVGDGSDQPLIVNRRRAKAAKAR